FFGPKLAYLLSLCRTLPPFEQFALRLGNSASYQASTRSMISFSPFWSSCRQSGSSQERNWVLPSPNRKGSATHVYQAPSYSIVGGVARGHARFPRRDPAYPAARSLGAIASDR